jgi:hypothetical protein
VEPPLWVCELLQISSAKLRMLEAFACRNRGCHAADIVIQHFPRFSDFRDSAFSAVQNAALLKAGDALGAVAEVAIQDLAIMQAEGGRGKRQEAGKGREAQWKAAASNSPKIRSLILHTVWRARRWG